MRRGREGRGREGVKKRGKAKGAQVYQTDGSAEA